jgi:hypothetical protein
MGALDGKGRTLSKALAAELDGVGAGLARYRCPNSRPAIDGSLAEVFG